MEFWGSLGSLILSIYIKAASISEFLFLYPLE